MPFKSRDIRIKRSSTDSYLEFAIGLNDGVTVGDKLLRFSMDDIAIGDLDGTNPTTLLSDRSLQLQTLEFNGTSFIADTDPDLGDLVLMKGVAFPDPSNTYEAANKNYVDTQVSALDLQAVTDVGNTTTNQLIVNSGSNGAGNAAIRINVANSSGEALHVFNNNSNLVFEVNTDGNQQPFFQFTSDAGTALMQMNSTRLRLQDREFEVQGSVQDTTIDSTGTLTVGDQLIANRGTAVTNFIAGQGAYVVDGTEKSNTIIGYNAGTDDNYTTVVGAHSNADDGNYTTVVGAEIVARGSDFTVVGSFTESIFANRSSHLGGYGYVSADDSVTVGYRNRAFSPGSRVVSVGAFNLNGFSSGYSGDMILLGANVAGTKENHMQIGANRQDLNVNQGTKTGNFQPGDEITGSVSGATAVVVSNAFTNPLEVRMTSSTDFQATDSITGSISGDSATVDSVTTYAGGINSVSFNRGVNQIDWQNPTLFSSGDIVFNTSNGNEWIDLTQQNQGIQINKRPDGGSGGSFIRFKDNGGSTVYGSIYGAGDDIVLFRDGGTNDNIITVNRSGGSSDDVTIGSVPLIVSDLSGTGDRFVYADSTGQLIEGNSSSDVVQNNFTASTDPLVTDDSSAGYSVGSMWYNTSDSVVWTAVDVSVGAAVWEQTLHNVFVPSGTSSDVTGFTAYAQRQVDSGQPIYLYSPTGASFEFDGGLVNTGVYCSAPWIGIGRGTNTNHPVKIRWSGTNTVLVGSGISGVSFDVANGSTTTIQGYSNHTMLHLADITFETGTTVTQFNFEVVNASCGRLFVQSGTNNTTITLGNRTNLIAQNIDINNATSFLEISSDSRLSTLRGDGTVRVGYDGGTPQNDAELTFTSWTSDAIEVHGDHCLVSGHSAVIDVKSTSLASSLITSGSTVTVESGAEDTSILGTDNTVTDDGIRTKNFERLAQTVEENTTGPVNLTLSDLCTVQTIDSASAVTVNLPSVDANDVGKWIKVVKLNTGDVTIDAADSDIIADSTAGGNIANTTTENYATMYLQLVSATRWVVMGFDGTWVTS